MGGLGLVTGADPELVAGTKTLVIGCGNLLRGDDAVGPVLVRHLAALGTPAGVRLADAGTAGMDVAFAMRGQDRVVIVDASTDSGHPPGTLFRVPGERLEQLPPPEGINLHAFRWDQALAFGRWLLKDDYPPDVAVWLVEAKSLGHGDPLSPVVDATMRDLAERLLSELAPEGDSP
ncbi:MAG: hydrogenase maturation protease [Mycobacteriaceae bacterium]